MFNITNHQRKANKNHNDTSHLSEWLKSKIVQITNDGEDVEKMEALYTVGGNVNWCSHWGKQQSFHKKLKIALPYDPEILVLNIYSIKRKH